MLDVFIIGAKYDAEEAVKRRLSTAKNRTQKLNIILSRVNSWTLNDGISEHSYEDIENFYFPALRNFARDVRFDITDEEAGIGFLQYCLLKGSSTKKTFEGISRDGPEYGDSRRPGLLRVGKKYIQRTGIGRRYLRAIERELKRKTKNYR